MHSEVAQNPVADVSQILLAVTTLTAVSGLRATTCATWKRWLGARSSGWMHGRRDVPSAVPPAGVPPVFHHATIRDVSRSGLRLESDAPVEEGQQAIVRLRNRPLMLTSVQWRMKGVIGVKAAERMQTLRLAYSSD